MTWPTSAIATNNFDAGTDSPATARGDLYTLIQAFNLLRAHVTTFCQGLLASTDAAAVRTALGLGNHQAITVDAGGNASVGGTLATGGNASVTGSISATVNISAGGNITAVGNVSGYSDERLKQDWQELPEAFLELLAETRVGTYQLKGHAGPRYAGVSAQSLQAALPEAVTVDEDGILAVAYGNAGLVAAVVLAREVLHLRGRVASLEQAR